MNILVTGGAGFIGSQLCERLILTGNKVFCLDNFNTFYDPSIKRDNISQLILHPEFTLIEGDIRNEADLDKCCRGNRIEVVVHLAAMAGVRPSIKNPELYRDVNVTGTMKVIEICKKHSIRNLIFASSSSVYGNKEGGSFKETDDVDHPVSPYAETKREMEKFLYLCRTILKGKVIVLRFFTCYGPRQRPDLAIHKFAKLLYTGKPIPVYGDGTTSRDYTYIDDTIEGIIRAIEYKTAPNTYEIFNLGESQTIRLSEMIFELEKASGKKAIIDHQPMQEGDVVYTCADITKSKELLGYNPKVAFSEGVRRFIEWFEKTQL